MISSAESRALLAELRLTGEIIHTPGHSEDSVSLVIDEECVFTGDLPRQEFAEGFDDPAVAESWRRIMGFGVKRVYPAHGPVCEAL